MTRWIGLAALLAGCVGAAADHERLGDAAYLRTGFPEALAEYRAASGNDPGARLLGKLGATALHTGDLREAASAFRRLAADDRTRSGEAAEGLDLVARAAERARDAAGLQEAIGGLRDLAPERVTGRFTLALIRGGNLPAPELIGIMPFALAATPDAGVVDSLLTVFGAAFKETTACEQAAEAYRAVLRRSRDPKGRQEAGTGLADCALELGRNALAADQPAAAARWFGEAVGVDSASATGREALVGLGDARVSQGDLLGAVIAYQQAISPDPTDPITETATQKLNALGSADSGTDTLSSKAP